MLFSGPGGLRLRSSSSQLNTFAWPLEQAAARLLAEASYCCCLGCWVAHFRVRFIRNESRSLGVGGGGVGVGLASWQTLALAAAAPLDLVASLANSKVVYELDWLAGWHSWLDIEHTFDGFLRSVNCRAARGAIWPRAAEQRR